MSEQAADLPVTLGVRLWMAREYHSNIRKNALAERVGIDRETVTAWEHDSGRPDLEAIKRWAEVCGVSFRWLAFGDNPPPPGVADPSTIWEWATPWPAGLHPDRRRAPVAA